MKITIEKSSIPVAWIDTSVLIKMAKVLRGEAIGEPVTRRVSALHEVLRQLAAELRLICPEGDQREEYEEGDRLIPDIQAVQEELSLGISFQHRQAIEDNQIMIGMRGYVGGQETLTLSYRDAFAGDPIEELQRNIRVRVRSRTPNEWIALHRETVNDIHQQWEELRIEAVAQNRTYEEQLERERDGILHAFLGQLPEACGRLAACQELTQEDIGALWGIGKYLTFWARVGGRPGGLDGLITFFRSDHFRDLPILSTKARLLARRITSHGPIERGDSMDVGCVAAVLPYCNVIVTDRKMRNHIRSLRLDEEYGANVFALRDHEEILTSLGRLRSSVGPGE